MIQEYRKLKVGMVGGGEGAFIGDVHRKAAIFDGRGEIAAGCFSRNWNTTQTTGRKLGIETERLYRNFEEMAEKEAQREDKIDYVIIVTPNNSHYAIAKAFMEKGIHISCDKPLTITTGEADELARISNEKGILFLVTYSNVGYPMVKQAREMIRNGDIGDIRMVMAEYVHGGLARRAENPTADGKVRWRLDPEYQGISGCVGDIGCHIENTLSYMTGLEIDSLCAKLDSFGNTSKLDNNAAIMIKYANGAGGVYWCSQIAVGSKNSLKVRIFGENGSIEWLQEFPNELKVAIIGKDCCTLSKGYSELYPLAQSSYRLPGGHPEGTYEAFANIYRPYSEALLALKHGETPNRGRLDFPVVDDGVRGVKFIEKCVESSKAESVWLPMKSHARVSQTR